MTSLHALSHHIRAALRDRDGVAFVELALIAPIILLLGVVGIEMANFAVTTMRVSQAAMHVADNGSRIGDRSSLTAQKIYESDINDMLAGVEIQAGASVDLFENGRVIISSLEQNDDGGQWIHWQRCMGKKTVASTYGGEGTGETGTDFAGMGESGKELTAGAGEAVIYVEIIYDYQPLVNNQLTSSFLPQTPISATAAFNVRNVRDLDGIYQQATPASVADCDTYEAL